MLLRIDLFFPLSKLRAAGPINITILAPEDSLVSNAYLYLVCFSNATDHYVDKFVSEALEHAHAL